MLHVKDWCIECSHHPQDEELPLVQGSLVKKQIEADLSHPAKEEFLLQTIWPLLGLGAATRIT